MVRRPHIYRYDAAEYRCCHADATCEPPRHAPPQPQGHGGRLDYVHACRHGPSSLLTGPGMPPGAPWVARGVRGTPQYRHATP